MTRTVKGNVQAVEMNALRRSARLSRTDRVRNGTVMEIMGIIGSVIDIIERN